MRLRGVETVGVFSLRPPESWREKRRGKRNEEQRDYTRER